MNFFATNDITGPYAVVFRRFLREDHANLDSIPFINNRFLIFKIITEIKNMTTQDKNTPKKIYYVFLDRVVTYTYYSSYIAIS